jgi:hypothetical protein
MCLLFSAELTYITKLTVNMNSEALQEIDLTYET